MPFLPISQTSFNHRTNEKKKNIRWKRWPNRKIFKTQMHMCRTPNHSAGQAKRSIKENRRMKATHPYMYALDSSPPSVVSSFHPHVFAHTSTHTIPCETTWEPSSPSAAWFHMHFSLTKPFMFDLSKQTKEKKNTPTHNAPKTQKKRKKEREFPPHHLLILRSETQRKRKREKRTRRTLVHDPFSSISHLPPFVPHQYSWHPFKPTDRTQATYTLTRALSLHLLCACRKCV